MKAQITVVGIIILLFCIGLSGCSGSSQGIWASKISEGAHNIVNMTEKQISKFPHLKEAILTNKSVDTPQKEINELRGILDYFDTNIIHYQNESYEVVFWVGDAFFP